MVDHNDVYSTKPNKYLNGIICAGEMTRDDNTLDDDSNASILPRTELDSHANMVLLGRHAYVFDGNPGNTCEVVPYDPDLETRKSVPIIDGAVAYSCPATHKTYVLIFRNALYMPSLEHNLVPPFIMREAGLTVNDVPKIHLDDPGNDDHMILAPRESDIRIPLSLRGIFSYFHHRLPTRDEILEEEKIIMTPDSAEWDPYSDHYARNEESMTDFEGNIIERSFWKRHKAREICASQMSQDGYNTLVDKVCAQFSALDTHFESTVDCQFSGAQRSAMDFSDALLHEVEKGKMAESLGPGHATASSVDALFEDRDLDEPILFQYDGDYLDIDQIQVEVASAFGTKPKKLPADFLAKIWCIKNEEAEKVLEQTTILLRQGAANDLSRRYSTNDRAIRYKRIRSVFYTDTFFVTKSGKSKRGNTCAQMFVSDKGFVMIYPMKSKGEFKDALKLFCKEVGVPLSLVCDPSGEQTSHDVKQFCHKVGMTLRILEESTQWANRAELYIGMFKEAIVKDMRSSDSPLCLWDYCAERRAKIHNVVPKDLFQLQGLNPATATLGTQEDISNICMFDWYDWCYYREESGVKFPYPKEQLGRCLGPLKNEGNDMAQAILTIAGTIVPRRTVRRLTISEVHSPSEQRKREFFDKIIRQKLGDSITPLKVTAPDSEAIDETDFADVDTDAEEDSPSDLPDEDPVDATGKAIYEQPFTDLLLNAQVILPQGEEMKSATVIGRSKDVHGDLIGDYNQNPFLNTQVYDVEFHDGTVREYSANTIAQNMYQQVDAHGHSQNVLDSIVTHKMDSTALMPHQTHVTTRNGVKRLRKSTRGWKLLVLWKDGNEQWVNLRFMKEHYPVQVAEYATANDLQDMPAFKWWVPFTLRKRDRIISAVKSRAVKATHKYGLEVPTSVAEAQRIDRDNNNRYWQDAIDKEMLNVGAAFEILDDNSKIPVGWTQSSGHLVFDIKMDFTRKARWVKDGHRTPDPEYSTYAGVVSRDSVRIALTYAALNDIEVTACDIKNAYIQAPSSEKHYVICGPEFGLENVGKVALIRRALYGGKSSGADFWKHLRTCMHHLGFKSCKADSEIWMRPAQKEDGTDYWEYVLLYVDDALCISCNGRNVLEMEIGRYWDIKEGSIGPPKIYLGNKTSQVVLDNGVSAWAFSSSQYVQGAIENVEKYMREHNISLPRKATSPFSPPEYRPEVDVSQELDSQQAAYYQSLIGILRWIVELGRVDIATEASLLASCMALPRVGHLNQVFRTFAYLRQNHNAELVLDPTEPEISAHAFPREDWSHSVYSAVTEQLPPNMPESRGYGFKIRTFVDSDHAGSDSTRRSRTGFVVFLNSAPIFWSTKKQTSVQTSTFGSEFIAMKECCEYLRGLRYKLRMMGIPCEFPSYIFGDNQSVLVNSTVPESMLRKKSSSIAYHFVRECVAADECRIAYISTHDNIADLLTKPLRAGEKRTRFIRMILHHI